MTHDVIIEVLKTVPIALTDLSQLVLVRLDLDRPQALLNDIFAGIFGIVSGRDRFCLHELTLLLLLAGGVLFLDISVDDGFLELLVVDEGDRLRSLVDQRVLEIN